MKSEAKIILENYINNLVIIDSHEHLLHERDTNVTTLDIFDLFVPYICDTLLSCGMQVELWQNVTDKTRDFDERLDLIYPYLELIRFTTYFRAFELSLIKLGIYESFCKVSLFNANRLINSYNSLEDIYSLCNIEKGLTFVGYYGTEYFANSNCLNAVPTVTQITPKCSSDLHELAQITGQKVCSIDDLTKVIDILFDTYKANGVTCIKFGGAYNRRLNYLATDISKAKEEFERVKLNQFMNNEYGKILCNDNFVDIENLDNFVVNYCLEKSAAMNMTIIFHTGIHAWNYNNIEATDCRFLQDVIRRFPRTKIVLLHFSFPHFENAIMLSQYYDNVYLDMAWVNVLDEESAKSILKKAIERLPMNKIVGFGGDYCQPINIVGHLALTKKHYVEVFSDLLDDGRFTLQDAEYYLDKIMYQNPKNIYQLK